MVIIDTDKTGRKILRRQRQPRLVPAQLPGVSVVIPCHNQAQFLRDSLGSVFGSSHLPERVVVVDDGSSDRAAVPLACQPFPVEVIRVDFQNQHAARRAGFELIGSKYVQFLDADNMLRPDHLRSCVAAMEANAAAAFVYPTLEAFGDRAGELVNGSQSFPAALRWSQIETANQCDANSCYRSEVLRQSHAFEDDLPRNCRMTDWRIARRILRSGPWHAVRSDQPLRYRIHSGQMLRTQPNPGYYTEASLRAEPVTLVVAFSGRWRQWYAIRDWLHRQSWPRHQLRLMILNSSHAPVSAEMLRIDPDFAAIHIERIDAGTPGLADQERRQSAGVRATVETAVSSIYNRAVCMAFGEFVLFLEDDVIPQRADLIDHLLRSMGPQVAAVSGLYRHRYHAAACAFSLPWTGGNLLPLEGPAVERVGGTGFGCLLARRSVLLRYPLAGDNSERPHYDVDLAARVTADGWQWILNRSCYCEHDTDVATHAR